MAKAAIATIKPSTKYLIARLISSFISMPIVIILLIKKKRL
jgi:hypothetical protein